MNNKAESFKKYLEAKQITCFAVDELPDNELGTVVFRSTIETNGQQLPTLLILDNSIYAMVRLLVAPKALNDENKAVLSETLNALNKKYKSFKYYIDNDGSVVLDCCLICADDINGDLVYTIFDVLVKHLDDEYKNLMKSIWN